MNELRLVFRDLGIVVHARIESDEAPDYSGFLLDCLPAEGRVLHAKWGGEEVWMPLSKAPKSRPDNLTILPSKGEILLVTPEPGACDLAIWYGRGWCFGASGFVPGCHVATVTRDLPALMRAGRAVLESGATILRVELAGPQNPERASQ